MANKIYKCGNQKQEFLKFYKRNFKDPKYKDIKKTFIYKRWLSYMIILADNFTKKSFKNLILKEYNLKHDPN